MVQPVPEGYHTVTPYLVVGDGEGLLAFLQAAFGAVVVSRAVRPDGSIANAEVRLGDSMVMVAQAKEPWVPMPTGLYLYVPDTDVTYRAALAAGGVSLLEPADQFYGDRNAGVQDPWGNNWWIATHIEDVDEAEVQRRMAIRG
ncbi:glyoxalase [Geothrix limicola]|uniref:Glyoxalase n=1 Tax=Geothrix limicola TaxID=2927978 RepID=A0ABQ5QCB9_9BACT|nr:VOC family protein [Geothrix limicola]GLH72090.1 glyoxalase [Geothrix limicola]